MFVFDLDGVIVDFMGAMRKRLEDDGFVTFANVTGYSSFTGIVSEYDMPRAQFAIEAYLKDPSTYAMAEPYLGAKDMVVWLSSKGLFKGFVTRRARHLNRITLAWLEEHGFPTDSVRHATLPSKLNDVVSLGGTILIEDNPAEIEGVVSAMPVVVFDQPYNRHVESGVRIHNWYALERVLKTLPIDVRKQKPWGRS